MEEKLVPMTSKMRHEDISDLNIVSGWIFSIEFLLLWTLFLMILVKLQSYRPNWETFLSYLAKAFNVPWNPV